MTEDEYITIAHPTKASFSEKKSKFLSFAFPIATKDDIQTTLHSLQKEFYDARHICYAYRLGPKGTIFRANDNGEPSGTAGRPILGQLLSANLTNVLVVVVRYFGGIKLGTSGLISAYKQAAYNALAEAEKKICTINDILTFQFEYPFLSKVMKVVKDMDAEIVSQSFDTNCTMQLCIRHSLTSPLRTRLENIETLYFI